MKQTNDQHSGRLIYTGNPSTISALTANTDGIATVLQTTDRYISNPLSLVTVRASLVDFSSQIQQEKILQARNDSARASRDETTRAFLQASSQLLDSAAPLDYR